MIKNIENFRNWVKTTKEGEEEYICEKCGKIFPIKKNYGKGSRNSSHYYRLLKLDKLICPWCFSYENFKKTKKKKSEEKRKEEQKIKTASRKKYYENKYLEDSKILYNNYEGLKKAYDKGRKGASFICSKCGEIITLKDRSSFRRYIKSHKSLYCKGCSISINKISNKIEEKMESHLKDCTFNNNQEYIGAGLDLKIENRPKYKFTCDTCKKEFESALFSNHPVKCSDCHSSEKSISKEEKELLSYIKNIYKGKVIENDRKALYPQELDIYLPELKLAIEYDGLYWHSQKDKWYHLDKTLNCEKLGISLVHVNSEDWNKRKDFIKGLISSYINEKFEFRDGDILDRRYYNPLILKNFYVVENYDPREYFTDGISLNSIKSELFNKSYFDCGSFKIKEGSFKNKISCRESFLKFRNWDFPYQAFTDDSMKNEFKSLRKSNPKVSSTVSSKIIRNFHLSLYSCHLKRKKTPLEYWDYLKNDYEAYESLYKNRSKHASTKAADFLRTDGLMRSDTIREGFTITKKAPCVSYFKPGLAKYLVKKYLNEFNVIFDPFSGFSGRLLGVCASNKKYIGQDINRKTVEESNNIINFLNLDAKIITKDIFESEGEYECLFTCSPYEDKEIWEDNQVVLNCDQWIDECLKRFKCKKYLFVVDSTVKYKENIVEEIHNRSHFGENKEYIVVL